MNLHSLIPFWKSVPQLNKKSPFLSLHNEVNRLFEDFFRDRFPSSVIHDDFLTPSINVAEQNKEYEITAELPGVEEKDVEVSVINNELCIYALKRLEKKEDTGDYHLRECMQGSFSRSIPLPYDANPDEINAKMKNGILKISINKIPDSSEKVKKINVTKEN